MTKPPTIVDLTWVGDLEFSGTSGTASMTVDSAGVAGPSPVQLLGFALAGCMATDVAHILKRGRHPLRALRAHLLADRSPEDPHRFVSVTLHITVEGDVPADAVERAIALSREKYCSVWHSMRQGVHRDAGAGARLRVSAGPAGDGPRPQRRAYVDWARGVAVLLMIEAHTVDAWTRLNVRRTIAYRDATILGGFAAPLFLWLAGLAVVLAATRHAERGGSRRSAIEMICRRGLEIFILGFLFRVQGFIVTPGSHLVSIFRVDILNIMGPSIVAAGLVWGLARTAEARVLWYSAIALAIAMLTPIIRTTSLIDVLPVWFQWYVRPAGDLTIFTLLPWAGFVFAGSAVGALIAAASNEGSERRLHAILAGVGATLVALGFYTAGRPSLYHASSFWTSSPTWFAIRVGIVMMALSAIYTLAALAEWAGVTVRWLERLGRSSLFVYWIHVELVYGYASWLWRHRLPLWGTAIAFGVFCALMYGAVVLRDRVIDYWRTRPRGQLVSAPSNS